MRISDFNFQDKFMPRSYTKTEFNSILSFLQSGEAVAVGGQVLDVFQRNRISITDIAYKKDGYEWQTSEIYHFEKYGLPLDVGFVNYVLNQEP